MIKWLSLLRHRSRDNPVVEQANASSAVNSPAGSPIDRNSHVRGDLVSPNSPSNGDYVAVKRSDDTQKPTPTGMNDYHSAQNTNHQHYKPQTTLTEAHGRYPDPPDHSAGRAEIEESLSAFMNLISHSMRPVCAAISLRDEYTDPAPHICHRRLVVELMLMKKSTRASSKTSPRLESKT